MAKLCARINLQPLFGQPCRLVVPKADLLIRVRRASRKETQNLLILVVDVLVIESYLLELFVIMIEIPSGYVEFNFSFVKYRCINC